MRQNEITVIVGKKGTGKTVFTRELMRHNPKKCLIVDTFDHPSYSDIPIIKPEQIKLWVRNDVRVISGDPIENIKEIDDTVYNALIILEDAAKYIDNNISKTIKPFFVNSKQYDLDMVIMFHRLAEIPPYVLSFTDRLVIHKTNENLKMSLPKFSHDPRLIEAYERVKKHQSRFYSEVIDYN